MSDKTNTYYIDKLLEKVQKKYSKDLDPVEANAEREKLEIKHGAKIMLGTPEDMETQEEQMDKIEYDALTKELYKIAPGVKEGDDMIKKGLLNQPIHNGGNNQMKWLLVISVIALVVAIIALLT